MENTNYKPQWLIDAEAELEKFNNSKYGKMSPRAFTNSENGRKVSKEKCIEGAKATNDLAKKQEDELGYSFKTIQLANLKTKEHQSKAAKAAGQKNVESGHWQKVMEANLESLKIEHTCPHCNKVLGGLNYRRWHGDNCKLNPNKNK